MVRQTDVAIVQANHSKTGAGQGVDKRGWPRDELHTQAHDEQHRGRFASDVHSDRIIDFNLELQAVGVDFHRIIRTKNERPSGV